MLNQHSWKYVKTLETFQGGRKVKTDFWDCIRCGTHTHNNRSLTERACAPSVFGTIGIDCEEARLEAIKNVMDA